MQAYRIKILRGDIKTVRKRKDGSLRVKVRCSKTTMQF